MFATLLVGQFSLIAAALQAVPVQSCSKADPQAPTAAERIASRTDLRAVSGTFGLQAVEGSQPGKPQRVLAYISTEPGKGIEVAYLFDPLQVACGNYHLPQGDATGTFYLSRTRRDGRYELIEWSGEYVKAGRRIDDVDADAPV